jgi:MFS family permease
MSESGGAEQQRRVVNGVEIGPQGHLGGSGGFIERLGIPNELKWGFLAVLIFMIGDGVEITFLTDFLTRDEGGGLSGATASFGTVTLYGVAVLIAGWFSGTLSSIWGPKRVMQLGAAWWVFFELIFLFIAIPSQSVILIVGTYFMRGFAYPLFAYAFLTWAQVAAVRTMRGSVAGWFWFAFTGGLPTLGALVAAGALGLGLTQYATLIASVVIVAIGGLIGSIAVRDPSGVLPIADEGIENPKSYGRLFEGVSILGRDKRTIAGFFTRIVNTAPEFGFFAMFPFVFGPATAGGGFLSAAQVASLATIAYAANIGANLFFGVFGDRFGWRRTVTWFGCVGCAITAPLWYFGGVASQNYIITAVLGAVYGIFLAGFVPLSALMPSMVRPSDKGASLAVLNTGAAGAAFVGPATVAILFPFVGGAGVAIAYGVMYVIVAILSASIKDESDPGEERLAREREASGPASAGVSGGSGE